MKAYEIQETFGLDSLRRVDLPEPQPGPGQVAVRVRATSLNYRDLMTVTGKYNPKQPLPLIPLSDGAGEVIAVGAGVTRVKVGERVAGIFIQKWLEGELTYDKARSTLGGPLPGMLREIAVLDAEGVVPVPPHLTDEEAATLPCAAVTAWHALVTEGRVKAGDTVLVQGTGGVSLFALQFARMAGARVLITSSSDEKLARVREELGADEGINYKTVPEWGARARELTNGVGVDHVVEVGGAGTLAQSLRAIRYGGRISVIGVLAGAAQEINIAPIFQKNASVQGIWIGSRAMFEAMNRAIAQNAMRPVIDQVFPFEEARQAFEKMECGAHFGKIVVRI